MLPDIQNLKDNRNKNIYKVGVRNLILPIIVKSKNSIIDQNTIGDFSLYTSLNESLKGANMSRYAEVIHEVLDKNIISIDIVIETLSILRKRLESDNSYMKIKFPYFIKKMAPVSGKIGYMNYDCIFEGIYSKECLKTFLSVIIPYTSLCPCSREISLVGAHNQLSKAEIKVELHENNLIYIEDIIKLVERNVSCEVYSILKRVDEKYVTEKAYHNPKFVEDVVRDISLDLDEQLDNTIKDYVIVVNHFESIHNHIATSIINAGRNLK